MKRAVFVGTFDPFTVAHYDIVKRGLQIFDEIIVGVGINPNKKTLFDISKRVQIIEQTFSDEKRVKVKAYNGATVDFAKENKADFLLRGLRSTIDFEYEKTIADANKYLSKIETVLLFTDNKYSFVSSSVVRELYQLKKDFSQFLPPNISLV